MENKDKKSLLTVLGTKITVISNNIDDYICLTDMAKKFGGEDLIYSWMRNRNTIEFLGIWEQMHNPNFKGGEFDTFKMQTGLNSFRPTPKKWIDATNAVGIQSRSGRYGGGTYAHKDLAFEFGSWLSPEFKLYLIKDFQRLKDEESRRNQSSWDLHRTLAKIKYKIHTDAIKNHIIPPNITNKQACITYANEADVLNVALFGITAKEWRANNSDKDGNVRDFASILQLLVLANLESINAEYIKEGFSQSERLKKLNDTAITQLRSLSGNNTVKILCEIE